jgi:integrase/recombinase XerD
MLKQHSLKKQTTVRIYIAGYLQSLIANRYSKRTIDNYRLDLIRFIDYAETNGIYSAKCFAMQVDNLLLSISDSRWIRRGIRSTVNRFIEYLLQQSVIPAPVRAKPENKYETYVGEFVQFQVEYRGICSGYSVHTKTICQRFCNYIYEHGVRNLNSLKPQLVLEFISEQGNRCMRKTMSALCSILRSFLAYLYRNHVLNADLAGVIIGPHIFKDESCPRFISEAQIKSVLAQIDRTTKIGMRDYAMVVLLATYGLRGIEVIRLSLNDIDWRRNLIHINSRKAGNNSAYPLSQYVSQALIAYLKQGRPISKERRIFLTHKAPYRPLAYTWALGDKVRQYMRSADIKIARPGTHTFRYSCAQLLLKNATPMKVISDYLGHIEPKTTGQYIKIDINDLRQVACGDGEEVIL